MEGQLKPDHEALLHLRLSPRTFFGFTKGQRLRKQDAEEAGSHRH